MPLRDDDLILDVGTHNIGSRAQASDALTKRKTGAYSLHHIVPYCYPLFLGFLIERVSNGGDQWTKTTIATLKTNLLLEPEGQQPLATKFAWMGANLFEGPAGNFRLDDPKDLADPRERVRPRGMGEAQWAAAHALGDALEAIGTRGEGRNGYNMTLTKPLLMKQVKAVLRVALDLATGKNVHFHPFTASDWLIIAPKSGNGSWYREQVKLDMGAEVTDDMRLKFRELCARHPSSVVQYTLPHNYLYKPMIFETRFWRLIRGDDVVNLQTPEYGGIPRSQPG